MDNSENPVPVAGTLRWTGKDFEGWYGYDWVSLTGRPIVGSVSDINGNVYKTIKIGDKVWMAENLKVTHYNDGTPIPYVFSNNDWINQSTGGMCWYDNNIQNKDIYGGLYNYHAVLTSKLCPL